MKNNELPTLEKLDVAIQSHKFYHQQCIQMEVKINEKIDTIFQTEEAGKNVSKKDIAETAILVNSLLNLSNKFITEAVNVINELDNLNEEEVKSIGEFADNMKSQLLGLNEKQSRIHERVEEIQGMLIEMYNVDEDDTF